MVGDGSHRARKNITVNGWTGAGYIITDPVTGAGAYKIAGGANGGVVSLVSGFGLGASSAATLFLVGALAPVWSFPVGIALGLMIGVVVATALYNLKVWAADPGCFWQGVGTGAFAVGAILEAAGIAGLLASLGNMPAAQIVRMMLSEAIAGFVGTLIGGGTSMFAASNTFQGCLNSRE